MKRLVPSAVATVLLLGGCGDDPVERPRSLPPVTVSPTALPTASATSPSASYSPAPLPEPQATDPDARAAEAGLIAYFRGINRLLATGDPAEYDRTYTQACAPCVAFGKRVRGIRAKGQRVEGAVDVVERLGVQGAGTANAAAVSATYRVTAYRIVASDGSVVGTYPESRGTRTFTLARTEGRFVVVAVQDPGA